MNCITGIILRAILCNMGNSGNCCMVCVQNSLNSRVQELYQKDHRMSRSVDFGDDGCDGSGL